MCGFLRYTIDLSNSSGRFCSLNRCIHLFFDTCLMFRDGGVYQHSRTASILFEPYLLFTSSLTLPTTAHILLNTTVPAGLRTRNCPPSFTVGTPVRPPDRGGFTLNFPIDSYGSRATGYDIYLLLVSPMI